MTSRSAVSAAAVTAVTVDLDDTLYPQADFLSAAWSQVASAGEEHGLPPAELEHALVTCAAEGSDTGTIIDRALLLVGVEPERLRLVVPPLVEVFSAVVPERLECYPGVLPALALLRSRVPLGCITDGSPAVQHAKLRALGLTEAFDALVISDEIGGRQRRKPHPAPFHAALARLGASPAATVHVGDRLSKDVEGSRRLGMRCIRVLTGEYADAAPDPGQEPWRTAADFAGAVAVLEPLLPLHLREDLPSARR